MLKRLLFAMVLTAVAFTAAAVSKSGFVLLKPKLRSSPPSPAASVLASYGRPASSPIHNPAKPSPVLLLPVQFTNPENLGTGKILVASRSLGDPNFTRTVVLLTHYDADGVMGLILNRRTAIPISQVLDLKAAKDRADPIYLGGPVQPTQVLALFQSSTKVEKADDVFGSVYLISGKSLFEKAISGHPDPSVFHVYLGYAGWTQPQLRAEVKAGAWFVFPEDAAAVFSSDPQSLWSQMIEKTKLEFAEASPQIVSF